MQCPGSFKKRKTSNQTLERWIDKKIHMMSANDIAAVEFLLSEGQVGDIGVSF